MSDKKRRKIEYKCQYCDKTYGKPCKVAEHERSHTGERPFVCQFEGCNKAYMRSKHLAVHEKSHTNIKDHVCSFEQCTASFSTRQHLIRHEKIHTSPMIRCDFPGCTAEFTKRFQLRWHKASHEKGTHVCETCSSTFDSLPALEKHRNRVHENPVIYNCHVCQQSFGKWTELRKHTLTDHPIQCTVCNKTYTKPYALKIHIKEKHAKQFKVECEWPGCGSVLATKRSYKTHVALVHEQDTRYKCDICSKGFPYKSMLKKHQGSHTPKSRAGSLKPKKSIAETLTGHNHYKNTKGLLDCPFEHCQFKLNSTYLLKRHLEGKLHAEDVKSFALDKVIEG